MMRWFLQTKAVASLAGFYWTLVWVVQAGLATEGVEGIV